MTKRKKNEEEEAAANQHFNVCLVGFVFRITMWNSSMPLDGIIKKNERERNETMKEQEKTNEIKLSHRVCS
jgi:hypothetical protein